MIDNDIYPAQDSEQPLALIASFLEPTYVRELPRADGWDNDILYEAFESQRYRLVSLGKDGRESGPEEGPISLFSDDLIMREGDFLTWPEGTQE